MYNAFEFVRLGLGEGFSLPAIYQLFGQLESHERTHAISKLYAGGAAGHLLSLFLAPLLPWRDAFFYFGATGLLWVVVFLALVPDIHKGAGQADMQGPNTMKALVVARRPVSYTGVSSLCCSNDLWRCLQLS